MAPSIEGTPAEASGADETIVGRDTAPQASTAARELPRGAVIGRYVVLAKLGAGGMGMVYAAYDPELDRKVALKLLHPGLAGDDSEGAPRLLREAQALAKLSHPNIVAVHDVGTCDGDVWIAMEFVEGRTLSAWLAEHARGWREVLAMIEPVALGLAAAHAAGLVHRDVKPDNVMLGDDSQGAVANSRVRLMDFGLARGTETSTFVADHGEPLLRSGRQRLGEALTQDGAMPGTPAYMSPEQFAGLPTDGRTDQFSLCVMLWEAVYGRRPFRGGSVGELATNVLEGRREPVPRGRVVPRWLRAVIQRGLAVAPEQRWPSIGALLDALARGRTRARVGRVIGGLGLAAVVGLGIVGVRQLEDRRRLAACDREGAAIDLVWNDEQRDAVRAGLNASGASFADDTAARLMPWLDRQADGWRGARTELCLSDWRADLVARSARCLDDRRLELDALIERLRVAGPDALASAVPAAAALRRVDVCRDVALLERLPAPPTEAPGEVEEIHRELARAAALQATSAAEPGLAVAREALARAEALGWPPLVAAARVRVGSLLESVGAYEDAASTLEQAYFEAARAGAYEDARVAAQRLAFTVGFRLTRNEDGERWARHAEVLLAAVPDPLRTQEVSLLFTLGFVAYADGRFQEAAELHERALAIAEQELGPEDPQVSTILVSLAGARQALGEYEAAAQLLERSLAIREKVLGPEHPDVAHALNNLGLVRYAMGAYPEAAALLERAQPIFERSIGAEHPDTANNLGNLAAVRFAAGDYPNAAALYERVLLIRERVRPDHPNVATALGNLANVRHRTGAYVEAAALHERALVIAEKTLGPEHPDVAWILSNLVSVQLALGQYEEAARTGKRALAINEKVLGPDHPDLASSLQNLAAVRHATGADDEAAVLYERARAIQERALGPDHPYLARTLVGLADVRRAKGALDDAAELYARALAIDEHAYGAQHRVVASPLVGLARVELARGRTAAALAAAERALRLRDVDDVAPLDLADARLVTAQALVADGGADPRALELARAAADAYRSAGKRDQLADAEACISRASRAGGR